MEEVVQPAILELTEASSDFLSGGVAGSCGVISGQPMDTIRIRQQQGNKLFGTNALSIFKATLGNEGFKSLFRGMSYPLLTSVLQNAIVFQSYGAACRFLEGLETSYDFADDSQKFNDSDQPVRLSRIFWSGCFAGAIQTAVVTPVDLLKIRLQLQTAIPHLPGYMGPLHMLRHTLSTEGLRGLYRGTVITAIRDIPSHGVYFAAFEGMKRILEPGRLQEERASPKAVWAAGGAAGAVSWISVYGFDVVKSRLQAQQTTPTTTTILGLENNTTHTLSTSTGTGVSSSSGGVSQQRYKGIIDCAVKSYKAEGLGVFFRGLPVTILRAFVVNGAIFSAYEASHNTLQPYVAQRRDKRQRHREEKEMS